MEDVEKAKVPQGVHGGGRVGLMLGVRHGCWGAEGVGEGEYKGSSWELMGAEGKVGGLPAKQGGGPPPPPSTGPVVESRKSSSYSRCWSVALQVVEVESIILSPSAVGHCSRLRRDALISLLLRFFSSHTILCTGLVAAVQSPASKSPLKVQVRLRLSNYASLHTYVHIRRGSHSFRHPNFSVGEVTWKCDCDCV